KNLIIPLYAPRVRRRAGGGFGDRDAVAIDILEEIGFERDSPFLYKPASALPHGYLKRLELARCLALRPDLLILDELFSGLSAAEVASLLPFLERLQTEGITLIMVEHRLRELFRLARRVLVLNYGRKIAEGPPQEVIEDEGVKEAYLGIEVA
ncbi:MAG: ABC transporter ATP-binding protein, partial [Candidatus Bipolaricaulia bacterium]